MTELFPSHPTTDKEHGAEELGGFDTICKFLIADSHECFISISPCFTLSISKAKFAAFASSLAVAVLPYNRVAFIFVGFVIKIVSTLFWDVLEAWVKWKEHVP